ncbi:isochorismatase family cysteine hydrolase [Pseudogracilibacillus sp. SE30717A]|uniref:cysteine hydrolase family protein n=1 Tax=Pseudogracilibacillus sp. SE30717A TaxID=3098293 RepID=UPI00300E451B
MLSNIANKVTPQSAALLVMDIQNDFCEDGGYFGRLGRDMKPLQEMVSRLETLIDASRELEVPIFFIKAIYDDIYLSESTRLRHERNNLPQNYCISGTWGAEFYKIKPLPNEIVINKHRYSSFTGTNLDSLLRASGIETVICTGTATNVCVEATAREAYSKDYHVVMVEDCCSTSYGEDFHEMTLENCRKTFGVVCNSEELIGHLANYEVDSPYK